MGRRTAHTVLAVALRPPTPATTTTPSTAPASPALAFPSGAPLTSGAPFSSGAPFPALKPGVPAVSITPFAVTTASPAAPTPPAAAPLAAGTFIVTATTACGGRRIAPRGGRGPAAGWHALDTGAEIGIDFHDPNAWDLRRVGTRATRAAAEPRAAHRHPSRPLGVGWWRCGCGRLWRLILLFILRRSRWAHRLGGRRRSHGGRLLLSHTHRIRSFIVTRQIDQLGVVRLAQQLRHAARIDALRSFGGEIVHRRAHLVGAHRLVAAELAERLAQQPEGIGDDRSFTHAGLRRRRWWRWWRWWRGRLRRRRRLIDLGAERDLELAVVEPFGGDQAAVRRLLHELAEP